MADVVDDIRSPRLQEASDANMAAFWLAYGRAPGCRFGSDPGASWFYTGIEYPLFNGVIPYRLQVSEIEPLVATLSREISAAGAPAIWWVGPSAEPADLGSTLERLGLKPIGATPGMALDLLSLGDTPPVPGLAIERVSGPTMQALWARTAAAGTEISGNAPLQMQRLEASLAEPGYRSQRRYIGFLDGEPVATSALVLDAGVAGIYGVATLPTARGRGIGRAMSAYALLDARQTGHRVAILQASPMGKPVYARMGFKETGSYRLYLQSE